MKTVLQIYGRRQWVLLQNKNRLPIFGGNLYY